MLQVGWTKGRLLTPIASAGTVRPVIVPIQCGPGTNRRSPVHMALVQGTRTVSEITTVATAPVVGPTITQVRKSLVVVTHHTLPVVVLLGTTLLPVPVAAARRLLGRRDTDVLQRTVVFRHPVPAPSALPPDTLAGYTLPAKAWQGLTFLRLSRFL